MKKIEDMIIELVYLETKISKATYDGRGVQGAVKKRNSVINKLSKELGLDSKYIKEMIELWWMYRN